MIAQQASMRPTTRVYFAPRGYTAPTLARRSVRLVPLARSAKEARVRAKIAPRGKRTMTVALRHLADHALLTPMAHPQVPSAPK